jgi:hypothetical protein
MDNPVNIFSELLANPLGELISSIGRGIGEAQAALDEGSLQQTLEIYREDNAADRTPEQQRMMQLVREIGYQPTFYVIPETDVEAQVSLSMTLSNTNTSPVSGQPVAKHTVMATPINAGNINRFGIAANAVAKLKFKIVPVPPPAAVAEMRVVPNLIDKPMDATTIELITLLGFTYSFADSVETGVIKQQTPVGNEIVKLGDNIVLKVESPPVSPLALVTSGLTNRIKKPLA